MYRMTNCDNINSLYIPVYHPYALSVIIHVIIIIRHKKGHSFTLSPGLTFGTEKVKPRLKPRVFMPPILHTSLGDSN